MTETEFEKRFIKARHEFISRDFNNLNDMQRSAVLTTEGPMLLLAGAGSGKTTVLINRIANLIKYGSASDSKLIPDGVTESDLQLLESYLAAPDESFRARAQELCKLEPVSPWRIIAITFTNKAANELKERLVAAIGTHANDIWAMTFHSACVRILRRDIDRLGYDRAFTIYDTADSQSVMKRILKDLEMDDKTFPYRTVLNYISKAKDAMISPEEFRENAVKRADVRKRMIGDAYIEYAKRLKEANALDFDDIILQTVRLLESSEEVRTHYQRQFMHVLVDEYQDTNNLQYKLTSILAGGYENICVVGDDDQSIYKFRGATIENILSFEKQYKSARVIRLEQNYRSHSYILEASNAVIKNNSERKGKELWTDREKGEKIKMHIAGSEREEASYVAGQILAAFSEGGNWSDHAILYRINAQSASLEFELKRNGIPYRVFGGTRFFDRLEIKDMLAYLMVIANTSDDLRLQRIINTPTRGIGAKTMESAALIARDEGRSIYDVVKDAAQYPDLQRSSAKLAVFVNFIEELRSLLDTTRLDDLYDMILDRTGYVRSLEAKDDQESRTRIENVRELKTTIVSFMESAEEPTIYGFLDDVALYTDLDTMESEENSVVMMTMHAAKGLEFKTVFIVGAEEGIFPSLRSIGEPGEIEEERRLCYVAMTRAMERLYITAARQRMLFGRTSANMVSRFVEEIPEDTIDKPEITAPPKRSYSFADEDEDQSYRSDRTRSMNERRQGGYGGGYSGGYSARPKKPAAPPNITAPSPAAPLVSFTPGDRVKHNAFGEGEIVSVTPAGADALLEVNFDTIGTKRLMQKTASQFMKKI